MTVQAPASERGTWHSLAGIVAASSLAGSLAPTRTNFPHCSEQYTGGLHELTMQPQPSQSQTPGLPAQDRGHDGYHCKGRACRQQACAALIVVPDARWRSSMATAQLQEASRAVHRVKHPLPQAATQCAVSNSADGMHACMIVHEMLGLCLTSPPFLRHSAPKRPWSKSQRLSRWSWCPGVSLQQAMQAAPVPIPSSRQRRSATWACKTDKCLTCSTGALTQT